MIDNDMDGFTELDGDCNDALDYVFPGAAFNDSPVACMLDPDGDGWGLQVVGDSNISSGTDCDDLNASLLSQEDDADCDGVLSADDCDDTDD